MNKNNINNENKDIEKNIILKDNDLNTLLSIYKTLKTMNKDRIEFLEGVKKNVGK